MNIFSTTVLLVLALVTPHTTPFPHGAPTSVCQSLLPKHHGTPPQPPQTAPYRIEVSSTTIGQGQTLGLRIIGQPAELPFEGFILQARSFNEPTQIIGSFNEVEHSKLMNCNDGTANSITHTSKHKKVNYYIEWNAPTNFVGEVFFNSTILAQFDKFWTGILSEKVNVVQGQVSLQTTQRPATAFTTTQTSFVPTSRPNAAPVDAVYSGCGQNKVCFGLPDNCIDRMSCTIFSSVKVRGDIFEIEMKVTDSEAAYVALGFSEDARMGDDLVTECVKERGQVAVYTSYTSGNPNYGTSRAGIAQNEAQLQDGQINNGQIYCRVQRPPQTTANGRTFNLATEKYHLLVAAGKSLKDNGAGYHDIGRNPSSQAINLAVVQELTSSSNLLIRLHGAFMIAAWIGTTSLGILIARYFKQTWVGHQICGKDMWFAWHRMCMVTTWALTMAAFVMIFVQLRGWSGEQNPHALLGTITTVICFLQPIGALFRPAPNASTRPIFNWIHWLGGNVAHILSVVTIFYAVKLTKAELPGWFDWILVAFVVYHVAMHLLFSVAACLSDKKTANRVSTFEMSDRTNGRKTNSSGNKMNAAYASFRKGLLGAYVFILLIFVVIFIVIVVLAPIEDTFKSIKSKVMN